MLRKKHARRSGKPVGLYTIRHGKPAADGKDVFTMEQSEKTLDMIVNLCKNRGYVFPGSEIYGGLANSWDYGLCCKFLPPKRHIRPRQSLATGFHATGKASGPERVRRPAAAMVLQSRGKWIVIGRKNDFRHIPECKIRLLRNSGRTHAVRPARMRISGTSAKIG